MNHPTSADERNPSNSDAESDGDDWVLVSSSDHASPPPSTDDEEADTPDVRVDKSSSLFEAFNARVARALIKFAPQPTLPRSQVYNGKNRPPLWRFGYAFELDVAFEYAVRHKLKMLPDDDEEAEVPTFETVLARQGRSARGMTLMALRLMTNDLSDKCGFILNIARTLSVGRGLKFVVYLWSNYDYDEQVKLCHDYDLVLHILDEAFKPFPGAIAEPFWYIDVDNDCLGI
ncbi:uncharacterized protein BXZ73DRAFT_106750 [Epithele typhae]|uniref:uncharacterized protein n=1 Tax=Epithele typhae TaxID=378194 RepID=UPI00200772E4|nr:uncharacterized protein BXZ73DRAFT_106750 [Epithele typhae]KAH9913964.1 hypothetical protein BXZ73DRAFT_106750 [Epithele typhae]